MCYVKDVHGEHYPAIFQLGQRFTAISEDGAKTVRG
jgi:hypothetical protein